MLGVLFWKNMEKRPFFRAATAGLGSIGLNKKSGHYFQGCWQLSGFLDKSRKSLSYFMTCQGWQLRVKPIFWVEINTKNMKCTWPTQDFCVGDPTQPIFHWLVLGLCVRANANFKFCVWGEGLAPRCWYPQRKVLASGALPNANPRRQVFCVAVEYRLKTLTFTYCDAFSRGTCCRRGSRSPSTS